MKVCPKCKEELPLDAFHKNRSTKDGLMWQCKSCKIKALNDFLQTANGKEYAKKRRKKLYGKCPETGLSHAAIYKLRKLYGLSKEDYIALLESANNKCEICMSQLALCVDHNHKTNEVRGILCGSCNRALGLFKDRADLLQKAQHYITSRGSYARKRK